jgi:hypothetical protein
MSAPTAVKAAFFLRLSAYSLPISIGEYVECDGSGVAGSASASAAAVGAATLRAAKIGAATVAVASAAGAT